MTISRSQYLHTCSRSSVIAWLTSWLFCGFFVLAAIGFMQNSYWPSAIIGLLAAVILAPPFRIRVVGPDLSSLRSLVVTVTSIVTTVLAVGVVAEWERGRHQAEFEQRRSAVLASAQQARAGGDLDALKRLAAEHRLIETPELDRVIALAREEAEKERQRIDEIQRIWLDAADNQESGQ